MPCAGGTGGAVDDAEREGRRPSLFFSGPPLPFSSCTTRASPLPRQGASYAAAGGRRAAGSGWLEPREAVGMAIRGPRAGLGELRRGGGRPGHPTAGVWDAAAPSTCPLASSPRADRSPNAPTRPPVRRPKPDPRRRTCAPVRRGANPAAVARDDGGRRGARPRRRARVGRAISAAVTQAAGATGGCASAEGGCGQRQGAGVSVRFSSRRMAARPGAAGGGGKGDAVFRGVCEGDTAWRPDEAGPPTGPAWAGPTDGLGEGRGGARASSGRGGTGSCVTLRSDGCFPEGEEPDRETRGTPRGRGEGRLRSLGLISYSRRCRLAHEKPRCGLMSAVAVGDLGVLVCPGRYLVGRYSTSLPPSPPSVLFRTAPARPTRISVGAAADEMADARGVMPLRSHTARRAAGAGNSAGPGARVAPDVVAATLRHVVSVLPPACLDPGPSRRVGSERGGGNRGTPPFASEKGSGGRDGLPGSNCWQSQTAAFQKRSCGAGRRQGETNTRRPGGKALFDAGGQGSQHGVNTRCGGMHSPPASSCDSYQLMPYSSCPRGPYLSCPCRRQPMPPPAYAVKCQCRPVRPSVVLCDAHLPSAPFWGKCKTRTTGP